MRSEPHWVSAGSSCSATPGERCWRSSIFAKGGKGVEKVILGGALASVPQAIAGMQRRIDSLPDGFCIKIRALEQARRRNTLGGAGAGVTDGKAADPASLPAPA